MTAAVDDIDCILEVMAVAFDPAYGEAWNRKQVEDALLLSNTYYMLAGTDGQQKPAGGFAAGFAMSRLVLDEEELLLIAVMPEFRGRGIGEALIQRFVEQARMRGASRVFLEMREGNPAERLYRRCGFEQIGRRPNYYRRTAGSAIDAITFSLTCIEIIESNRRDQ